MSDFLTNLAARTMAAVPLRPRTRMRFEPDVVGGADGDAVVTPAMEARERPAMPSTTTLADPLVSMRTASDPADERGPERGTSREQLEPVAPRAPVTPAAPPDDSPAAARVVPAATEVPLLSFRAATTDRADVEARSHAAVESPQHVSELVPLTSPRRSRGEADMAAPPSRPHRFDLELPDAERAKLEPRAIRETVVERRLERRSPSVDTRQAGDARRRTEQPVAAPEPDAPEPVVHVSIGRVEIRAVPPAASKPAPRRNAAMTIDEYAARRRERR